MAQRMLTFGLTELKPVISNRHSVLQETEILELFNRQEGIVCDIPFKPKGGEVYLFKAKETFHQNDWRADGHR